MLKSKPMYLYCEPEMIFLFSLFKENLKDEGFKGLLKNSHTLSSARA